MEASSSARPLIGMSVCLGHDQRMHAAVEKHLARVRGLRIPCGDVVPGARLAHVDPEAEARGWIPRAERLSEQEFTSGAAEFR